MKEKNKIKDNPILSKVLLDIEKEFGKGSIMEFGSNEALDVEVVSSGSLLLDKAIGVGGYPKGRVIEVYGPESSGKTTLALHAIAEAQKAGLKTAFIDAEHAIDPQYAKNLGVDIKELILSQPDSGEQALEITDMLVRSGEIGLVVVDSVAALVPEAELNGEMSDQTIGAQARLMSKALRKLSGVINKSKCIVIFINQIREKVGVIFGNPEVTPGGRALKFFASLRLEVRRKEKVVDKGEFVGNLVQIKVVKNKVAQPFKTALVEIEFGKGISMIGEVIDLAVEADIIHKAGSWYSYQEEKIGQGKDCVKKYLEEHQEIFKKIYEQVKA